MIFNILLFMFCIAMCFLNAIIKNDNVKKYIEIITLIVLCIISGTRYNIGGSDYGVYKQIFEKSPVLFKSSIDVSLKVFESIGVEIGYLFFNSIVKTLGFNFYGLTLIHSIFFYTCMYIGLKKYVKNFNFFIIIFLYKLFYYNTFISMRQSIAIAIFFLVFKYIEERKFFKYAFGCILAFLFHNSAIILLPIYFINKLTITKKKYAIIMIVGVIFLILNVTNVLVVNPQNILLKMFNGNDRAILKLDLYFNASTEDLNIIHSLEFYLIGVIIYIFFDRLSQNTENEKYANFKSIIKFYIILVPVFTIFRTWGIVTRIKDYFIFTYAVILYCIIKLNKRKYELLVYVCVIIISFYGYIRFITRFNKGVFLNYQSYITQGVSIFTNSE